MIICALSDQHGHLYPERIPPCDLLLVAGDVAPTNYGPSNPDRERELQDRWMPKWFNEWLDKQPCKAWLACWGNHDYASPILGFHDGLVVHNGLRIWFSPWSNEFCGWNWMQQPEKLKEYYDQIPEGVDIIVSHQPPYGAGDHIPAYKARAGEDRHVGSRELLATINRVKPKFLVCGHIHNGNGLYRLDGTTVFNVAVVDEDYRPVNIGAVFDIDLPGPRTSGANLGNT